MATNIARLTLLRTIYLALLKQAIAADPETYSWAHSVTIIHGNGTQTTIPAKTPEDFTDRYMVSIIDGGFTIDAKSAPTLRKAVKAIGGIKPTKRALTEWLQG